MEKLIFIFVIFVISALHSWWKKRQGEPEEDEDQPSPQPPRRIPPSVRPTPGAPSQPVPPRASNWEEELRRLLEGETAAPRPPAPPPVVVARPPPIPSPAPVKPRPQPAAPLPYLAHSNIPVPDEGQEEEAGLPVKMPTLEQSAQAYLRARTLDARVTERMHQVEQAVITHPKFESRRERSPAIRQGVAMLSDRQSQRAALIASVVLGPPKALEQTSIA